MRLGQGTWTVCCYTVSPKAETPHGPDGSARPHDPAGAARSVLDTLAGLEPELRAAAVVSAEGEVLASTTEDDGFGRSAAEFADAVAAAGPGELDSSHVATERAEVFMVTDSGYSLVAVTARFVLASLTSFDIRMSLRDLASEVGDA